MYAAAGILSSARGSLLGLAMVRSKHPAHVHQLILTSPLMGWVGDLI